MSPSYNVRDQGGGWLDELVIPVPAWLSARPGRLEETLHDGARG